MVWLLKREKLKSNYAIYYIKNFSMEYELSTLNINHKESREILVYETPEYNQIDTEEERNKNEIENDKTTKIHSTTLNTNDNLESKNEPITFDLTNDPNITKLIVNINILIFFHSEKN